MYAYFQLVGTSQEKAKMLKVSQQSPERQKSSLHYCSILTATALLHSTATQSLSHFADDLGLQKTNLSNKNKAKETLCLWDIYTCFFQTSSDPPVAD